MSFVVLLALCASASASAFPSHAKGGRLWRLMQEADHNATFQQRYYQVDKFWTKPTNPILLYIGGEGSLDQAPIGFVHVIAEKFGAKILALEHRFYDLKHFKESYQNQLDAENTNHWIVIGGSYPGALAAWFRVAYPDPTIAALSSSGVVQPVYKFYQFDEQVALATGPLCADVLRLTTAEFEKEIASSNGTKVKELFGAQNLANADFFYIIADAAAMAVQYGHKDVVCESMTRAFVHNYSLIDSFAHFTIDMYGSSFGSECFYDTKCLAHDRARWGDGRSWRWEKCSQVAFFQIAPKEKSLRAAIVDLEYHLKQCHTVFGHVVHPLEGVEEITELYGGDHPPGHKIFFSNGGDDPWQRASVLATLSDDEIANLARCEICGHCGDLRGDPNVPEPSKKQREEIVEYLTKWLGTSNEEEVAANVVYEAGAPLQMHRKQELAGLHRSSPLVLIPIVVAFLALVVVIHSGLVRDAPGRMETRRYRTSLKHGNR
ncbi:unnamed protein product [Peronospora destructor]|uniref:Serine protease n=1 Tax=Peronospora destructor TaxID=86335 RepID=A0AAV0V6C5_9STRA|nr:unnamed protein product [Peronospora destructor]